MYLALIKTIVSNTHYPGGIRGLASEAGMSEPNLHRCIRENKIQAQDLETIANLLKVPISVFFDDPKAGDTRTAGRDFVEHGNITHKESPELVKSLNDQISQLKDQLGDKQRIIDILENRKP